MSKYNTPIPKKLKPVFDLWVHQQDKVRSALGRGSILNDKQDYDIQGAWLEGETADEVGHWTDKYKKPNHPTFSNQSQYSNEKHQGGVWMGDNFAPSKWNILLNRRKK